MSPLPANNTKRYKLLYSAGSIDHSITMRTTDAFTDAEAITAFTDFADAAAPGVSDDTTFEGVEVALSGSNIFNAVPGFTPVTGTGGSSLPAVNKPRTITFPGRTSGGHKTRVVLFGVLGTTPATWEESPLVSTFVININDLLVASADHWLGIDGVRAVWYDRLTWNDNDHYVRLARS